MALDPEEKAWRENERLYKSAQANWNMHHQIKTDSFRAIDNIMLLVGTGSFGISIAFFAFLGSKIIDWPLIVISWSSLLVGIFLLAKAQEATANASLRNQHLINLWLGANGKPSPELRGSIDENMDTSKDPQVKELEHKAKNRRDIAMWLLITGIVFLILFAAINFLHNQDVSQSLRPSTVNWHHGY
jgi:uncharacterized integral membrane protein